MAATNSVSLRSPGPLFHGFINAKNINSAKGLFELYTDIEMKMIKSKMVMKQTHTGN